MFLWIHICAELLVNMEMKTYFSPWLYKDFILNLLFLIYLPKSNSLVPKPYRVHYIPRKLLIVHQLVDFVLARYHYILPISFRIASHAMENHMVDPVPVTQPWMTWENRSCDKFNTDSLHEMNNNNTMRMCYGMRCVCCDAQTTRIQNY